MWPSQFATGALFEQWRSQYGLVNASLGLGAIYLLLSGILYLCCRRVDLAPFAKAHSSETLHGGAYILGAAAEASGVRQAAALAIGAEIAQQMTPLQLTMIAAISGFAAGRKL